MDYKYGKKSPKNAPAIALNQIVANVVIPGGEDYLSNFANWQMLGNDSYGDCVAVTWANVRRFITNDASYPNVDAVFKLYETQNPDFPREDNGMDIQTALEYLHKNGGPDGVKPVAFAKVNHNDMEEVEQALAIFGYIWTGINVLQANEEEFDNGQPWDYISTSPSVGGHSVISGGYDSDGNISFITWATETKFTKTFWKYEVDEAWVVIWPEHFTKDPFIAGIDQNALATTYQQITGSVLPLPEPIPPTPTPVPGYVPFLGCDPKNAEDISRVAAKHHQTTAQWMNHHFAHYFGDM